jgi:hypothetical protein
MQKLSRLFGLFLVDHEAEVLDRAFPVGPRFQHIVEPVFDIGDAIFIAARVGLARAPRMMRLSKPLRNALSMQ